MVFPARRAVRLFSPGDSPVVKVLYKLAAQPPTTTLSGEPLSNFSPLRTFGPKGRQPSRLKGVCHLAFLGPG